MARISRVAGWSLVVAPLVVGAFFAGRLSPSEGAAAAPAAAQAPVDRASTEPGGQELPHVWFMMGPGTIPRNPSDRLNYLRYALDPAPRLTGEQMLEQVPEIARFARVSVDPGNMWEYDTPEKLRAITLRVNEVLARPDVDGVIFGHGTNNIEETAYWLNLTVKSDKPVVIVGAQRPFSTLSSDGPLNLLNAIRVAGDPQSRGKGVLVLLNDEINAARDVTKTNTY